MFSIDYEILEKEKSRISKVKNITEFEADVNTIIGQIQLVFNESTEGFVDKEIPFDGEFLLTWFQLFNDVIVQLSISSFAAINLPDSGDFWMEFELDENEVLVSLIEAEPEMHVEKFIVDSPKVRSKLYWFEIISKDELFRTIQERSKKFMDEVLEINGLISESKEFKKLEEKYINAKGIMLNQNQ